MTRVLILGGTGFIGSAVVKALCDCEIAVFHRTPPEGATPDVRHLIGDRTDLMASLRQFREFAPDIVLDMVPQNANDAKQTVSCFQGLASRAVVVSSLSVYRAFGRFLGTEACPIVEDALTEEMPLRAKLFPYRGSRLREATDPKRWLDDYDKIPAEQVFLAATDLPSSIVRLPMVYGPGDADSRVGTYVERLRQGTPLLLAERAAGWRNARNFVRNIADAIALVTLKGSGGRIYNAPGPHDYSEIEWIRHIARAAGLDCAIGMLPDGNEGAVRAAISEFPATADYRQHLRMNGSRLAGELGHSDAVSLEDGLRETVAAL